MEFYIPEKDAKDKAGTMYYMLGKNRNDCNEIKAGDIGALLKLKNAKVMNSIRPPVQSCLWCLLNYLLQLPGKP